MTLSEICEANHYPIIFIGSGMSRRYLENFPVWTELLEEYWKKLGMTQNYYSFLHNLTAKYQGNNRAEEDFYANTHAAQYISSKFDEKFYAGEITINNLSIKQAQQERISPFKQDIANRFLKYTIKSDADAGEFAQFAKLLQHARMIVTTNYDRLVEKTIWDHSKEKPAIYLGADGLFNSDNGYSEIYKIHGSATNSNSIVITADDYEKYDQNSLLVSAKLMAAMIDTPIIFFGYSLTDRNVMRILDDFSQHIPKEDPRKSANRIVVVEYHDEFDDDKYTEEIARDDSHHGMNYTLIKTKNFSNIFEQLSAINEGATPYEIRKYTGLIKKLIVKKGAEGSLDATLITPESLDHLEGKIDDNKPIVVALGDIRSVMVMPDLISYTDDYINGSFNYEPAVALAFAARHGNASTKIPFAHYWNTVDKASLQLPSNDWTKLNQKVEREGTFEAAKRSINIHERIRKSSIEEILASNFKKHREIEIICWNAKELPLSEIDQYIADTHKLFRDSILAGNGNITSPFRRLLVLRDLKANGEMSTWNWQEKKSTKKTDKLSEHAGVDGVKS